MSKKEWTVLLVGGSSGIGKTQLTKALAENYETKIIEADDISCAIKAMTTGEAYPAIHYWHGDVDWRTIGVQGNVQWLSKVSDELSSGLKAIVDVHVEEASPVIVEGDFISVKFAASFKNPKIKAVYIYETDEAQIVSNYLQREGGESQTFRASISAEYGKILKSDCDKYGVSIVASRPWETLLSRVMACIDDSGD